MPINSRTKGKVGERELAAALQVYGLHARRSQQYKGTADSADVEVTEWPEIHIECKRVQALNVPETMTRAKLEAGDKKTAILFHRRNHKPWLVTMELEDFMKVSTLCPPMFHVSEEEMTAAINTAHPEEILARNDQ